MKQRYVWLTGGLMTLALAGCIENGLSSSNRGESSSQADRMAGYGSMDGGLGLVGQGPDGQGPGAQGALSGLADELALTADQKAAIKTALTSLHQRMRTGHHRGERPTFEEMKARRAAMQDSVQAILKSVLDSTQLAKAMAIRAQIESGERPSPMALAHVKRLTEKLALDSTQAGKITAILSASEVKRKAAMDAATGFEDLRTRMTPLRADTDAQILAVLTDAQAAIFKTLRQGGRDHEGGREGHRGGWFHRG